MNAERKRRFSVAGGTAPTAEPVAPAAPTTDAKTPKRQDAKKSAGVPSRTAFTWRRTPAQAMTMDELTIRLKRELERPKLDHAEILAALVDLAADSPPVFGALAARLQQTDV